MIISESVKRIMAGGDRVAFIAANGKPIYINADGLVPYLPALKANANGTGAVGLGGSVAYVEDLSGNGNHAVVDAAAYAPIYNAGGGLYFDGTNHYLSVAPSASLDFGGRRYMTVEAWVKSATADWAGTWNVVSRYAQFILGPNTTEMAMLIITTQDGVSWEPINYESLDWGQASDPGFYATQWHHYSGVVDTVAGISTLYIDGLPRVNFAISTAPIIADAGPIHLGHRETDVAGTNNFSGRIADVRIWDVARTQVEVQRDMNRRLLGHEVGLKGYWPF